MPRLSPQLAFAINQFISWFEDNFGNEEWLDLDDDTDGPDGTWKSYLELPEYLNIQKAIKAQKDD